MIDLARKKDEKDDEPFRLSGPAGAREEAYGDVPPEAVMDVPIIGNMLRDFSLALAARWMLWVAAIAVSFLGLGAVLVGTGMGYLAVGGVSSALVGPLDSTTTTINDFALVLDNAGSMGGNATDAGSSISASLRNMSKGLGGTADSLGTLSGIPGAGSLLGGLSGSLGQIKQSASGLNQAADDIDNMASTAAGASASLANTGNDLRSIAASLAEAKTKITGALSLVQLAIVLCGGALALLLGSNLMLALSLGPPRRMPKTDSKDG